MSSPSSLSSGSSISTGQIMSPFVSTRGRSLSPSPLSMGSPAPPLGRAARLSLVSSASSIGSVQSPNSFHIQSLSHSLSSQSLSSSSQSGVSSPTGSPGFENYMHVKSPTSDWAPPSYDQDDDISNKSAFHFQSQSGKSSVNGSSIGRVSLRSPMSPSSLVTPFVNRIQSLSSSQGSSPSSSPRTSPPPSPSRSQSPFQSSGPRRPVQSHLSSHPRSLPSSPSPISVNKFDKPISTSLSNTQSYLKLDESQVLNHSTQNQDKVKP